MRLSYGSRAVGYTCFVPSTAVDKRWTSIYLRLATVKPRSASSDGPWLIPTTAHRTCSPATDCEVVQRPFENAERRAAPSKLSAPDATLLEQSHGSDHRHIKRRLRSMHGPRTLATACAVIAGIEAVQMIRKGQVLGITKKNLHGQAWVFGSLLGLN